MFCARKFLVFCAILGMAACPAAIAFADWDEGDGHKMHFPQLPDPQGWDVRFDQTVTLADDWQCSESGPVSDIHFWFSWLSDLPVTISQVHTSIHRDIPAGTGVNPQNYSRPEFLSLWTRDFQAGQFTIRDAGTGNQGWHDPVYEVTLPQNHQQFYQLNITGIEEPFVQQQGEIYWLDLMLKIDPPGPNFDPYGPAHVGWKTSLDHFMDSAVFFDSFIAQDWVPISIPIGGGTFMNVDMAFVITPEPGTFALLAMAGMGLGMFAWRRRRERR